MLTPTAGRRSHVDIAAMVVIHQVPGAANTIRVTVGWMVVGILAEPNGDFYHTGIWS